MKLSLEDLNELAVAVLVHNKTSKENAQIVAQALVASDAMGIDSHGAARLPAYAAQANSGKVDGFAIPVVDVTAKAAVRVDAKSGFAFPAIQKGLETALDIVKETGITGLGIGNSHHMGMAGYHVEQAAKRGILALAVSNTPSAMAPWGGNQGVFGTNPIAFACPRPDAPPLVIDLSLSRVARGKIKLAADKGEPIEPGWAVDKEGNPTTNAQAAMEGTMLPIGGAKGAALALMVEILSATLTGSNHAYEAASFFTADGPSPGIGHFFVLVDPDRFALKDFCKKLTDLLGAITDQPGTRLPGEKRINAKKQAMENGVTIPDSLYASLCQMAGQ